MPWSIFGSYPLDQPHEPHFVKVLFTSTHFTSNNAPDSVLSRPHISILMLWTEQHATLLQQLHITFSLFPHSRVAPSTLVVIAIAEIRGTHLLMRKAHALSRCRLVWMWPGQKAILKDSLPYPSFPKVLTSWLEYLHFHILPRSRQPQCHCVRAEPDPVCLSLYKCIFQSLLYYGAL